MGVVSAKKAPEEMTLEDLINAVQTAEEALPERPAGYYTSSEICEASGMSKTSTNKRLNDLLEQGKVDKVVVTLRSPSGKRFKAAAYRLRPGVRLV